MASALVLVAALGPIPSSKFWGKLLMGFIIAPIVLFVYWPFNFVAIGLGLSSYYWWKTQYPGNSAMVRNRVALSVIVAEFALVVGAATVCMAADNLLRM